MPSSAPKILTSLNPQMNDAELHTRLMQAALSTAAKAQSEVPVGAVVVLDGQVIAEAHNRVEELCDPTAHAEILALRDAAKKLGRWRLNGASLYVTLEPCVMCIGAILHSRIDSLYFGAYDPVQGAVGSLFDLSLHPGHPRQVCVFPEILAEDSSALLKRFFDSKRG